MHDDSSASVARMLREESAYPMYVLHRRLRAGFDLNANELSLPLKHKIDLVTRGRSPVSDCRARCVRVSPCEQVTEDEVLEMRATRLAVLSGMSEVQSESGIIPIQLGCFDQALGPIHRVGWQTDNLV